MSVDYRAKLIIGKRLYELSEEMIEIIDRDIEEHGEYYTDGGIEQHGGNMYSDEGAYVIGIEIGSDSYCEGNVIDIAKVDKARETFKKTMGVEADLILRLQVS